MGMIGVCSSAETGREWASPSAVESGSGVDSAELGHWKATRLEAVSVSATDAGCAWGWLLEMEEGMGVFVVGLGVGIGGVNAGERDGLRVVLLDAGRGCVFPRCRPVGKEVIAIVEVGVDVLYATLLRVCILGEGEEPGLRVG